MSAEYWEEAIGLALDETPLGDAWFALTKEQRADIGEALQSSHENYGMAHYSPPASDRIADIEREWRQRVEDERDRTEAARQGAEKAVRRILGVNIETAISVTDDGEVYRYGGRIERIA